MLACARCTVTHSSGWAAVLAVIRAVSEADVWVDGEADTDCDGELPDLEPDGVGDAGVWLGLLDGVGVGVLDGDGVGVGVLDGDGVGVGVLDGDGVGFGVFVGVGVGVAVLVAGST